MAESLPKLLNDIILQIQEADSIPNWMTPKKSMPRYITAKLLKTKDIFLKKRGIESNEKEMMPYLQGGGGNSLNGSSFLIKTHGGQKEMILFSRAGRKELSIQNPISCENILQE